MERETLMPLKCLNCFQMTESRELFDSSGALVTTNASAVAEARSHRRGEREQVALARFR